MDLIRLSALLVYTLGAFSFGAIVVLWARGWVSNPQRDRSGCVGNETCARLERISGMISMTGLLWFVVLLIDTLAALRPGSDPWGLNVLRLVLTFAWPPLIMHVFYAGTQVPEPRLVHPAWVLTLRGAYLASATICITGLLKVFNVIRLPGIRLGALLGFSIGGLFVVAAIYSALTVAFGRKKSETSRERDSRRWTLGLFAGMLFAVAVSISLAIADWGRAGALLDIGTTSLPLLFVSSSFYFENRFEFFDVFVKRGLAVLLTIVILTICFAVALPLLGRIDSSWAKPWAFAIVLLPAVMALPWLYRTLNSFLDDVWLGRRFTPVEAVKHFLSGLQRACTEEQLLRQAERGLNDIFHAPARIRIGLAEAEPLEIDAIEEVPIRCGERRMGTIFMGRRANDTPYFGEDLSLLGSLADLFSHLLETIHLQERKREQDRRAKELSLHASRSELKALRAQINPHFLFNALNAIAGLIHKDPLHADKTVEQLAEVFRYTLRRSECEWVLLEEELEFVRSYLDVEQARFGERLRFDVSIDDDLGRLKMPSMLVQTLVENAVKHGVASICGPATIEVFARRDGDSVVVTVTDNGRGFEESRDATERGHGARGQGFGLKSVRQRLSGYFGDQGALEVSRDDERALTVVSLRFPIRLEAPPSDESRGSGSQGVA